MIVGTASLNEFGSSKRGIRMFGEIGNDLWNVKFPQ
jgi:hypothetical protein